MKRTLLLASALCLAAAAYARPDTVYVAHGTAHTPRIELADGHAIEPRPMPGDTLTAIAQMFDTTVAALAERNGLADPSVIYVGQIRYYR